MQLCIYFQGNYTVILHKADSITTSSEISTRGLHFEISSLQNCVVSYVVINLVQINMAIISTLIHLNTTKTSSKNSLSSYTFY